MCYLSFIQLLEHYAPPKMYNLTACRRKFFYFICRITHFDNYFEICFVSINMIKNYSSILHSNFCHICLHRIGLHIYFSL